ncbi:MAG: UPF0047 protein YjbQ [uncultured Caballeronia sp.]|nr:MAG: UPF0047 protein YjbQ [uncultured Caballeronia sp.]
MHETEGHDDMPAHLRTALTTTVQLSIPVEAGRMVLGTWQGILCVRVSCRAASSQTCLASDRRVT